jgi:uncharacterized protein (DUF433 family)
MKGIAVNWHASSVRRIGPEGKPSLFSVNAHLTHYLLPGVAPFSIISKRGSSVSQIAKGSSIYAGLDPRELPAYPIPEAAQFLRMPVATLRSWVLGRLYGTRKGSRKFQPVIVVPDLDTPSLSYMNLVEAHVLRAMRFHHGIQLRRVRTAIDFLRERFASVHPLAEHDFLTDGFDLLVESFGELINASSYGQAAFSDVVRAFLQRIDRDPKSGLPLTLYPLRYDASIAAGLQAKPVALTATIAFGQPVVPNTGVKAAVLFDRWSAGETLSELSDDYGLEPRQIEPAIQWYAAVARKAA